MNYCRNGNGIVVLVGDLRVLLASIYLAHRQRCSEQVRLGTRDTLKYLMYFLRFG